LSIQNVVIDHIDTWTTAKDQKAKGGRGRGKKSNNQSQYGVKKLRELILDLAVHGKLVMQDPNDEPASVLLEKIATEKARLIKEGKIKKQKPLPEISEDEKPFGLPDGWYWTRLGEVTTYGITEKSECNDANENTWILELEDVEKSTSKLLNKVRVAERPFRSSKNIFLKNDVIYGKLRPYLDKVIIADEVGVCSSEMIPIRGYFGIVPAYLRLVLKSPYFKFYANNFTHGMNLPRLGTEKARLALFPFVSDFMQYRIVSKVDELMALCDKLEQEQTDNDETHLLLVKTLLDTLTNAKDHKDFIESWWQIEHNFDILFTTEESIDVLKQTILQLAVMGKLVPQDPNDEPASVLLKKIALEKARLVNEGKIKKQKPLPEISEDEKPFELPKCWQYIRLGEAINLISGQHLKPAEYSETQDQTMIPYLTGPAEFGLENPIPTRFTLEKRAFAENGDVLITCKGSGVGKLNIADTQIAISRQLMSMQPMVITTQYLFLMGDSLYNNIRSKIVGIAIPGISREDVLEAIIGLPPIAEQQRIVAKVSNLYSICDSLRVRLNVAQTTQVQLADAVVKSVT
jgi:type I restriction enzyme S subunit